MPRNLTFKERAHFSGWVINAAGRHEIELTAEESIKQLYGAITHHMMRVAFMGAVHPFGGQTM